MIIVNDVQFVGNVVRDFELRKTTKEKHVVNFEVIVDNPASPDNKVFVEVKAWGKVAEKLAEFSKKGSKIFVKGRLDSDKFGMEKGSRLIVVCEWFFVI